MKTELKNTMKLIKTLMRPTLIAALALIFAAPVAAQEKVKLNLPDGVYQSIRGCAFIVKSNKIYDTPAAVKKFGIAKLNEWFAGKKNKILYGGEVVGEIYNAKISEKKKNRVEACQSPFGVTGYKLYVPEEKIPEGPLYSKGIPFSQWGSVRKTITVPDAYKESPRKIFSMISSEELAVVSKLVKEQLLAELKNKKELERSDGKKFFTAELSNTDISYADVVTLEKISRRNGEMYIGFIHFIDGELAHKRLMFSAKVDNVKLITGTLGSISGMLDMDGCGEDELIVEKGYGSEDESFNWLEIYKQKMDGSWVQIIKTEKIRTPL